MRYFSQGIAASIFLLSAHPAVGQGDSLFGLWDFGADEVVCTDRSDTRLRTTPLTLSFHETDCILTNPVDVRDIPNAQLLDAACVGEGQSWEYRVLRILTSDDRLVLVSRAGPMTYTRCAE